MASIVVPSSLPSCPWIPVDIGDSRFLCKCWFGQTQYHVLLMDSECLWEEQMKAEDIQARAQELNRRLRASIQSFFSHLVAVVTPCLTGMGGDHGTARGPDLVTLHRADCHMTLKLKSELAGLPFNWEFHCRPAPVSTACVQLVRPLLMMSGALQRQVEILFKQLQRKDAEIQDYRENGAQLTRERLQTEPFEEEAFRQDFMTKTLPLLLDHQEASLDLDSDLQGLFSCIMSRLNSSKRKRQNSVEEGPLPDAEETTTQTLEQTRDGAADVELSQKKEKKQTPGKKTTQPIMQQSTSSPLLTTERPAPKPKKKKVGLFR
ncbi:non-homologous end-joining factor 1 [Eucyclogobius newberryi]|uniref:non-homologous end-joining factor 1 n=1 Tax=Eucyclogobius newberryi TaxID=166745 RepID=UPI003B5AEC04